MQKIIFLLEKELHPNYYRFEPADYGPFSWQLSKDVDFLVSTGFLEQTIKAATEGKKYEYTITGRGTELVERVLNDGVWSGKLSEILSALDRLKRENNRRDLRRLLHDVYSKYPEYARKSRILV